MCNTLENNLIQASADNRFMEPTFDTGTFPCEHWRGVLSRTLHHVTLQNINNYRKQVFIGASFSATKIDENKEMPRTIRKLNTP